MRSRAIPIALGVLTVLAAGFAAGYGPKTRAHAESAVPTRPRVVVVTPKVLASERVMVLPGSVQALEETVVYARVSGYTKRWLADIGDDVREGQLLAEIDTPELDQELEQAAAQLEQAKASSAQANAHRDYSKTTLDRYQRLGSAGLASQQDLDQRRAQSLVDEADVGVARANVAAHEANIRRLLHLKSFARVVAPFHGTIVSRTVERGALVTTGNAVPLFKIAATDPVRVLVQIPQDLSLSVQTGLGAKVTVREFPGQSFDGVIARSAHALDPASRTMTTVVRVPNPARKLLVGMYAQVSLSLPTPHRVLEIPATALLNDAKGVRVTTVCAHDAIRSIPIVIERDTGATIEVASGLDGGERIVKIARPDLHDGEVVEVVP
ncbi:efflux RND transporter periplasmic adaptor subunit [Pendulispora rubella]|uniref:Efflux RND transporter periplasmic adaptor subunit n=1 Tax=Pendulispora rubella TaxID=2741070 RepID=A0ABZ2L2W2_9BACT